MGRWTESSFVSHSKLTPYYDFTLETWKDGDIYVCEWKDGELHGKQTRYYSDGKIYNSLQDREEIVRAEFKKDQAFFTCTGEVQTALDDDTYE